MKNYIVEGIGTFFLVLTIALTGNPLAIGAILIAMVYMGGYISGAHYNPAVTLAVFLRGGIKAKAAINYVIAQLLGSLAAAFAFANIKDTVFIPTPGADVSFFQAVTVEALFTFALASAVLHVATSRETKDNNYYGLAIGLTVMAAAFAGGSISGGVYNPAVAVGPMIADFTNINNNLQNLLIYLIGPFTGAALAAFVYRNIHE